MTLDAPPPPPSTMRRDLLSAYAASGMKVASWALATTLLLRYGGPSQFALFALIRGTLSFLNYTTLGLSPAIIHEMTRATAAVPIEPVEAFNPPETVLPVESQAPIAVLSYVRPTAYDPSNDPRLLAKQVGFSAMVLAVIVGVMAGALAVTYAGNAESLKDLGGLGYLAKDVAFCLGLGLALRLASDVCGALLQAHGFIERDNMALVAGEGVWIIAMLGRLVLGGFNTYEVAALFLMSSCVLLVIRVAMVPLSLGPSRPRLAYFRLSIVIDLLAFGLLVSIAQLADYLYAPTDFLLINHLLGLRLISVYAPAVQIDAGLLLIVGGLAAVMLPKAAIAHAHGDSALLRRYFVRGTLSSAAMLLSSAIVVYFASAIIFKLWLGDSMPATQAILPLILIHTVVGGSSAVGRSILLGMGKVKPFTIAVLIAGVSNVILSYSFVRFGGLGLNGIVLGTICAVVGRCAIWQPWYVWRCLREQSDAPTT